MVEIRYKEYYEVADLAGQSVAEARKQFNKEFGIPEKAAARLNGKKVKGNLETETCIADDDRVTFTRTSNRGAFLIGAMLLALAATGGVFAFGWINATNTIGVTAATNDFAAVTANTSDPLTWTPYGFFKGSIAGPKPIFDINTADSGYTGDLVLTVSLANADELVKCYRVLALKLDLIDGTGTLMDINESGGAGDADDYALLTLGNGAVDMFPGGFSDNMTIRVKSGFYITHIYKGANWGSNYEDPVLFCEVAQR
ncbi:hypothetical protein ACFLV2_00900 [Chloroflexota bacterium]